MKPVLIITYYWPPSGGSGVQRWLKFTKYLPEFGYEPIILTVDPQKASYPVLDESLKEDIPKGTKVFKTSTFELFSLYKRFVGKGSYPHSSFDNEQNPSLLQKLSRFVRGNFFIPDSRVGWKRYAVRKAKTLIKKYSINHVITTGPPHSAHLIGLELKRKLNIKWIADFRDPWTDIFFYDQFYHTGWARKIDIKYERDVVEKADRISIVSQFLKEQLAKKSDQLALDKIEVIANGFDDDEFDIPSNPPSDTFLMTFTGAIANDENKLNALAEALSDIRIKYPNLNLKIRFVGIIDESINELFKKNEIYDALEVVDYVPHKEAISLMKNSTILFYVIRRAPNNQGIVSGKVFDYLGALKPILSIGPENGDAQKILYECAAGQVIDYEAKERIVDYLSLLIEKWKVNSNLDLQKGKNMNYSRKNLTGRLAAVLSSIS